MAHKTLPNTLRSCRLMLSYTMFLASPTSIAKYLVLSSLGECVTYSSHDREITSPFPLSSNIGCFVAAKRSRRGV